MNYYVLDLDQEIALFDTDKSRLQTTLKFKPELTGAQIEETEREIVELDGKFVFADEHQEEIEQKEQTKADEEAQAELQETIAVIKADMVAALLSDDTEWQEELKDEYNAILNGEE